MMRVICLLLVSVIAIQLNAQQYTKFNGYGFQADRLKADSISIHPSDTVRNKAARSIAVLNGVFYIADGTKWKVVGTDTTSLSNRINLKLNIADTINKWVTNVYKVNDSTIAVLKNGVVSNIVINPPVKRLVTNVYNNTASTITKGSVVYISGRHSSNLPTIALAEANNEANSYRTFALVQDDIPTSSSGVVVQAGNIDNLNLPTSTYTDGDILYLSPTVPGGYTLVKPLAPFHICKLGSVTRAHPTLGSIEIKIENGWQLDELSDVSIAAVPLDSTILQFSRVDSLWHDVNPTTAMGNRFVKPTDTATMLSPYIRNAGFGLTKSSQSLLADSLVLSTRAWRQKGLDSLAAVKQNNITLTTSGTSGASTLVGSTLNIPQYQGVLTNPITGTGVGTSSGGRVPYFTGTTTQVGSDNLWWDNTNARLGIGTTTPANTLDVNGTARVQDNLTVSKNQNSSTILTISNTTAGSGSQANMTLTSDATAGNGQLFKYSSSRPAYKSIGSSDLGFYNATGGNISILNDFASGNINFTAGANSIPQLTIASNGNITQSINQNASTTFRISNTTSGTASESILLLTSNNGNFQFGKSSSTKTAFKTISANDGYIFNDVSGNISILNNFTTGNINFAAGGASTAQATLFSTGNLALNTTTDAGYRLDVNGTARVQSSLVLNGSSSLFSSTLSAYQNSTNRVFSLASSAAKTNSATRILFSLNTNEASTPQSLDFAYNGATFIGDRYYSIQTSETGVAYGGGFVLQKDGGWVGIGSSQQFSSAALAVTSTTQGFLPPRMTTAQRDLIATPATGLIIYNTSTNKHQGYNGTTWNDFY